MLRGITVVVRLSLWTDARRLGGGVALVGGTLGFAATALADAAEGSSIVPQESRDVAPSADALSARTDSATEPAITWLAPSRCVSQEELRRGVEGMVRAELVPPGRRLEGKMAPRSPGFVATFSVIEDGRLVGRRVLELESEECREATEALELVAAMLLEGGLSKEERAAHRQQELAEKGATDDTPPPHPGEPVPPPSTPAPAAVLQGPPPVRFRATLAGGAGWGMEPKISPGGLLELGVRGKAPVWLHVQGAIWGKTWSSTSASGAQVGVSSLSVSAFLCAAPEFARLEWGFCAGWGFLSQTAEGRGAPESRVAGWDQSTLLLALRVGGDLWGPLGWTGQLRFDLPAEQVSYVVQTPTEPDVLFLSAAAYASTFVGISATF